MRIKRKSFRIIVVLLTTCLLIPASIQISHSTPSKSQISKALKERDAKLATLKADVAKQRKIALAKAKADLEASRALTDLNARSATRKSAYAQLKDTNNKIRDYYQKRLKAIYSQYRKSIS